MHSKSPGCSTGPPPQSSLLDWLLFINKSGTTAALFPIHIAVFCYYQVFGVEKTLVSMRERSVTLFVWSWSDFIYWFVLLEGSTAIALIGQERGPPFVHWPI